jgi:hypothetical protein
MTMMATGCPTAAIEEIYDQIAHGIDQAGKPNANSFSSNAVSPWPISLAIPKRSRKLFTAAFEKAYEVDGGVARHICVHFATLEQLLRSRALLLHFIESSIGATSS